MSVTQCNLGAAVAAMNESSASQRGQKAASSSPPSVKGKNAFQGQMKLVFTVLLNQIYAYSSALLFISKIEFTK